MSRDPQDDSRRFSRRTLLTRAAALGAGAVVSAGALASQTRPGAAPVAGSGGPAVAPRREPLETLTTAEGATGGNAAFVGWDLIGYPGIRLAAAADDQRMDRRPVPLRRSAYDNAMFSKKRPARASLERPHAKWPLS
jgi:hypothetical protein